MGFKLITSCENGAIIVQLKSNSAQILILPQIGALLQSYQVKYKNEYFECIDGLKNISTKNSDIKEWYRSAKLSPFPARILDGKYTYEQREYSFQNKFPDGSAIHGLLFNQEFEVINQSILEHEASVDLLHSYRGTDAGYPFHYDCYVQYILKENNELTITTTIVNEDIVTIPIADGWHPYFTLGGTVDDWILSIEADEKLQLNEKLIPNGNKEKADFKDGMALKGKSLDDCFIITKKQSTARLINPQNNWQLDFSLHHHYPYLQIFTPDHRQSIAIEPFSAAPNSLNNHIGLTFLKVAEQISYSWSLHLNHK